MCRLVSAVRFSPPLEESLVFRIHPHMQENIRRDKGMMWDCMVEANKGWGWEGVSDTDRRCRCLLSLE